MEPELNRQANEKLRHHVTVLFSDLSQSTRLTDAVELETSEAVLNAVKSVVYDTVAAYDGVITQWRGDGVTALFGYPIPREDAARRALEAALEIHREVRELDLDPIALPDWYRLCMHSGVETGAVLVRAGDQTEGRFHVTGPAINTASALSASASADQVLASESTLRGFRSFFVTSTPESLQLKSAQPVTACEVIAVSRVRTRMEARSRRGLTRFVGREAELARMRHRLDGDVCANRRLRMIAVVGDAGVGKTRLVEEFLQRSRRPDVGVLRGHAEDSRSSAPLGPFRQMFRALLGIDPSVSRSELASRIDDLLGPLNLESDHRRRLGELLTVAKPNADRSVPPSEVRQDHVAMLTQVLSAMAQAKPRIIFIDDWQWVDDASRQLVASLAREAADSPILLVAAFRKADPVDPTVADAEVIHLGPFGDDESERIIRSLIAEKEGSLDYERLIENIRIQSGGNPLFIEELCRSPAGRAGRPDASEQRGHIPEWLYGLIEARVARLPPEHQAIVRAAAVIGDVAPCWLLERVADARVDEDTLGSLAPEHLVFAGETPGTLRFKHGITRQVLYESLGREQRMKLHAQIAEVLEETGDREDLCEELAYHYAGAGAYEDAADCAVLAAEKAEGNSLLDRARQHYGDALRLLAKREDRREVRARWVALSRRWPLPFVYNPDSRQLANLEKTVRFAKELGDRAGLAHAYYWLGYFSYALGVQDAAIENFERARAMAEERGDKRLSTQILATLGQSHAARCNYGTALRQLSEAIDIKRRHPPKGNNPPVGSSYAMACKALVLADQGDFDDAHEIIGEALRSIEGHQHEIEGSICNVYCAILFWQGRWPEAIELSLRVKRIAERSSLHYLYAMGSAIRGYARFMLGDVDALDSIVNATEYLERRRIHLYISLPCGWVADAAALAGRHGLARTYAGRALKRARQGDRLGEAMALRAVARIAGEDRTSPTRPPLTYLQRALAAARSRGSGHDVAVTHFHLAKLLAREEQAGDPRPDLDRAIDGFRRMHMAWHLAQAEQLAQAL